MFIVAAKQIGNLHEQLGTVNENYNITFADRLRQYSIRLRDFNREVQDHIFDWQMDIKHSRSYDSRVEELTGQSEELARELEEQLYYFIPKILANLESDREQLRKLS